MEFEVVQGDITARSADAIVNAANTDIEMGGGVAGAIREAAGRAIQIEAREKAPIDLGGATWTGGYDLDAPYVVHAATMHLGGGADESSVRGATRNALATADELGCKSLVTPALGCGIAGLELDVGARYIFEEILAFDPESLEDVRVIGHGEESYRTLTQVAERIESASDG